jgi:DNA-binding beta-propeller fold protein YncE
MAWDPQGNTYISDGYINSRVVKIDKEGNWLTSWGDRGAAPGLLHTPHSIATDAQGHVYVADRGNRRIQVFDGNGQVLRIIQIDVPVDPSMRPAIDEMPDVSKKDDPSVVNKKSMPGSPWAICIPPGASNRVMYVADAFPGRIYKLSLDGQVLGVLGRSGKQLKQFGWVHEIACPTENTLWVAELLNWRVQKLILHP